MATCCGHEQDTPYCGWCQEPLPGYNIGELLRHVQHTAEHYRNRERINTARQEPEDSESLEAIATKWEGWQDALGELIERDGDATPNGN